MTQDAVSGEQPRYGTIDRDYARRMLTMPPEEDGPVWMVNLMAYRDRAEYADGDDRGRSGREADDAYAPVDSLAAVGAEVVFVADVERQLLGDDPRWDRVAVVRYPTRRAFLEMQQRSDFQEKHVHKEAGMAATIVAGSVPIPSPFDELDQAALPDWSEVPHPPSDDDPPVVVFHALRFEPGRVDSDMREYERGAGEVAVPHGVRVAGWFGVEGVIVGDGRSWDQLRFNAFPSLRAFLAVVADPARLRVQADHREPAIADTYTLVLRPTLDRLAASTTSP